MVWLREDLAWVAGLFEGEGSVGWYKRGHRRGPGLAIASSDKDVLSLAEDKMSLGYVRKKNRSNRPSHHKQMYVWHVGARDEIYALMVALYPWLGERRKEQVREWVGEYKDVPPVHVVQQGENSGCNKLDRNDVVELRERYSSGEVTYKDLGAEYGVAISTVCAAVTGRNWGHV